MERRNFIEISSLTTVGLVLLDKTEALWDRGFLAPLVADRKMYEVFKNPDNKYRPFVRWW